MAKNGRRTIEIEGRGSYHHGDLRRALIDGTVELIRSGGSTSFTLREVARRAGVSHAAPYRHFKDRRALLAAVAAEWFVELGDALRTAGAAHADDPRARLREQGVTYVQFAVSDPPRFRLMFGPELGEDREVWPDLDAAARASFATLLEAVAACQQAELIPGKDPVESASACWALVHGLAALVVDGQLPFQDAEAAGNLARVVGETLWNGLTVGPDPA